MIVTTLTVIKVKTQGFTTYQGMAAPLSVFLAVLPPPLLVILLPHNTSLTPLYLWTGRLRWADTTGLQRKSKKTWFRGSYITGMFDEHK